MSGPKRNPDKLNSIGIVVVGICGAVLVYVSIVALQAFYMDDTSEIQTMADYGGQDVAYKSIRAQQLDNLSKYEPKAAAAKQLYTIDIRHAITLVVESAKRDPSNLVPAIGPAVTPSVQPVFGRPKLLAPPAPAGGAAAPAGAGAAPAGGTPASETQGDAPNNPSAPQTPTGGQGPGGGPPAGNEGQKDPSGGPATPPPAPQPKGAPATQATTPKAPAPAAQTTPPKAPAPAAQTTPPKAPPAQPKAPAPKGGAPAQPKKGNAP